MNNDVTLTSLLATAQARGTAIGAFNVVLFEHAEAIVEGAERAGEPVILQLSENCIDYHGSLAPITLGCLELARRASVDVLVHLDHITRPELVREGIEFGVDSVMFDASRFTYEKNVETTREIAELCHADGVAIEAELGEVGGKDGVHAPGARTKPAEAAAFVEATNINALAVAVGTSHAMTERVATLDLALIEELAAAVPVPLVLHGSSGVSDADLSAAVSAGMAKINISTHLNALFTRAVRDSLAEHPETVDPRKYVRPGRTAVEDEVTRLLELLATPATPA